MKRSLLLAIVLFCAEILFAQKGKEEAGIIFNPHWYLQLQGGMGYTVGETGFKDLISPAGALSVGYQFSPVWGLRGGFGGWQGKGAWSESTRDYKFNFLQLNADVVFNLSNCIGEFNPRRWENTYFLLGIAGNHAFDNDEAVAIHDEGYTMRYLWRDNRNFVAGRGGVGFDFRISNSISFNIEGNVNVLSDHFNSKKAGNADWQFNVLAGFSCRLNKKHRKVEAPREIIFEETVPVVTKEEPVSQPVLQETKQDLIDSAALTARQDIFFALNSSVILASETAKIDSLVAFMKTHTETQVVITGYADVQTGNPRYNKVLSQRRAEEVAVLLTVNGISRERITVFAKGDTEQPFPVMEQNRVAICLIGKK